MSFRAGFYALSGLALMAFATTATAAGSHDPGPSNWSGFWLGVGIGSGDVDDNRNEDHTFHGYSRNFSYNRFNSIDEVSDGVFGTMALGFDRQVSDRIILGAFTDFDFSGSGKNSSYSPGWMDSRDLYIGNGFNTNNESSDLEHKYSWNIGGRVGMTVFERSMVYGLLAYTRGTFHQNYGFNGAVAARAYTTDLVSSNPSQDITFHGLTLGGGFETMLARNLFLRGEYRYTRFEKESSGKRNDIMVRGLNAYDVSANGESFRPTMHTGRIVIGVKFNSPDAPM